MSGCPLEDRGGRTYAYALPDEIVLVCLELHGETVEFDAVVLVGGIEPLLVECGVRVLGRSDSQALDGLAVLLGVAALLGLGDGGLEGIDAEGHRGARNEEQSIEAGSAWRSSVSGSLGDMGAAPSKGKERTSVVLDVEIEIKFGGL